MMAKRNLRECTELGRKRVLVHLIKGRRRAYIIPDDLTGAKGHFCTDDRTAMSEERWETERIRRIHAIRALTPDERAVIREYWELRDG